VILVDTSVWVGHLRANDSQLEALLEQGEVLCHPFVAGEIGMGSLRQRKVVLEALKALPQATSATDSEVERFVADQQLFGLGIGWVDAHLLASARLTPGARLWTLDKRLRQAANRLGLSRAPH
jgi:predicted nucleic acid-binding protein